MEYDDFKLNEADAFELDHVIRNPQNLICKMFLWKSSSKSFLPRKLPAYGS